MHIGPPGLKPAEPVDIKSVPPTDELRQRIREAAGRAMAQHDRSRAPTREFLDATGRDLLSNAGLPESFLGFAMVALNNAFWHDAFAAVPFGRRLFLLPHCMRDEDKCAGKYDSLGLHCAGCGSCRIDGLKAQAEALGYRVLIAEGTTAVTNEILDEGRDAVLGVACLDSLEKSFARVVELGIPHLAVPLLSNGCVHTQAETPLIEGMLREQSSAQVSTQTYLPLLREARRLCAPEALQELLAPFVERGAFERCGPAESRTSTEALAIEWLREGGKRFRPFVTLAAYAVARHGAAALRADANLAELLPLPVRRLALAIESLHKASLVHDDIEDGSPFRYGRATLHQERGVPAALNVGDYLVGLGYRLVAGGRGALGAERVADILDHLTSAHLQLCRGQGAEMETDPGRNDLRALDVLAIHAMKTGPAFEAALYAGLRAADAVPEASVLRRFSACLGEGYQILNDLDDWRADDRNKIESGQDAALSRPTILRAFALEAGGADALEQAAGAPSHEARVELTRRAYDDTGAFDKARALVAKLRERALRVADALEGAPMRELFGFLVRVVLDPS
ncbi:MAG TPA: polyprenyl synthetase family protein [Verrucomicrobiae bacterium]|nr:polyprenyl synthetase family protein [Verrucomicrobiae bacterium]